MKKILIIQTAFIGDVILATSLIETAKAALTDNYEVHCMVRKGNEGLLANSPLVSSLYVWDKKANKYGSLFQLLKAVRKANFDVVINLQRFGSTGLFTALSKAKLKIGFKKNPFSFTYTSKVEHTVGDGSHEIERNAKTLLPLVNGDKVEALMPKIYPTNSEIEAVKSIIDIDSDYFVLAPSSVWFTKQLPAAKWLILIQKLSKLGTVCLIGAPTDGSFLNDLIEKANTAHVKNFAGKLSLMESAVLIKHAKRSYVNDSAPLHLASAMNAPVTAFFCSTVPNFGFGPLSTDSEIKEVQHPLSCRPCGLHGFKSCPKGHFECGNAIDVSNC